MPVILFILSFWIVPLHAAETTLRFYQAFAAEGGLQGEPELAGLCTEPSRLTVRPDAWRCRAGDTWLDPCFSPGNPALKSVRCVMDPWTGKAVRLRLPQSMAGQQGRALDMSQTYPWAIELLSGSRCLHVETDEVVEGLPVHYRCSDQSLLLGHVQRCDNQWMMLRKTSQPGTDRVALAVAWF